MLQQIQNKIIGWDEAARLATQYRFRNKKMVFTNGCFDLLHRGHVSYLAKARELGQVMFVGLNTDASVRRLKGANRPLQDETTRALIMASLQCVDHVVLFDQDTPLELITYLLPDVLTKGADYAINQIVGADVVIAAGGSVQTIELVDGFSTTNIVNKMQNC